MENINYFIPDCFKKDKSALRESSKDVVINYIKEHILNKQLVAGERLPTEDDLATQLKVGRGSVREASKVLETIGILSIERRNGISITHGDISKSLEPLLFSVILADLKYDKIIELRYMFEISIFDKLVTSIKPEQIENLRKQIREMEQLINQNDKLDIHALVEMDFEFHSTLSLYTDNPLVDGLYRVILCLSFPFMQTDYQGTKNEITAVTNHSMICDALEQHDMQKLRDSIRYSKWLHHDSAN